ncbi:MAG TPA: bifunctional YncE family protein/alkaline phosphatase family protein [Verrucomicrobiae bacterium]|nr:bifunctional YncE family protein/alkaline phosphatase family protein [Verrucomicrobiae bacterium]
MKNLCLLSLLTVTASAVVAQDTASMEWSETVGRTGPDRVVLPVNQVITPAGRQIELHGLRPQVLALSPDGKLLLTSGKTHDLLALDPETGAILQSEPLPDDGPLSGSPPDTSSHMIRKDKASQASFTGLAFSPDGTRVYLSNVRGSIKVFAVSPNHRLHGLGSLSLPNANAPRRHEEIPAGLAVSRDGKHLYVVGNLSNRLFEFDLASGKIIRTFEVGAVPYDVVLAGHKAYVSNWAGRRPDAQSLTGPAGLGTQVRVDPVRNIANEGSVSVVDLDKGVTIAEIMTGLHASALRLSPDQRYLAVANANSDTVTVIATATDRVVETIPVRWQEQDLFGAAPNALDFDSTGRTLYVCNGSQNAVAVVAFRPAKAKPVRAGNAKTSGSKIVGLIPTGWYPGAIVYDAPRHCVYVANIKGTLPDRAYDPSREGYNSHQHLGTLSFIPVPTQTTLKEQTAVVLRNYRRAVAQNVFLPARAGQAPAPVPERIGEPSVFKHVVYLIKENRTYDQVFGDIKEGNGDPRLCSYPEETTPNQHRMVRDFVLLDNTYCCGILSADGHQWSDTAFATDYMEKSFADFPRSYPDMQELNDFDAVAYASSGFIWDNVLAHGKTFRNYGEGTVAVKYWNNGRKGKVTYLDCYHDFVNHTGLITYSNFVGIDSLRPYNMTNIVGWDLEVPDVYRSAQFLSEFNGFVARGDLPNFMVMDLPNDHTSGTDPGRPTPAAQVADNDLAFGQIVAAISHSPYWKDTCIFAIEDDPQSGWDHVSGYRTTAYVISAYTRRHAVVSINYNTTSLLRTMELILGLPPMNQLDASATPMNACFTSRPDFTPFECQTNNVPLDQMNPTLSQIRDRRQYHDALVSSRLPLDKPDQCRESVLNKILWHAQMGFARPYPQWAITEADDD